MVDHWRNCCRHCMTETDEVHRTMHDLRIVVAAVMPTKVLPAPHGKTMMPDRARLIKGIGLRVRLALAGTSEPPTDPLPNILPSDFSWYGRSAADGFKSISSVGLTSSCRKSYSSIMR